MLINFLHCLWPVLYLGFTSCPSVRRCWFSDPSFEYSTHLNSHQLSLYGIEVTIILGKLSGLHSGVAKDSSLLGCDTLLLSEWVIISQRYFVPPTSGLSSLRRMNFGVLNPWWLRHCDLLKFQEWHAYWQCCNWSFLAMYMKIGSYKFHFMPVSEGTSDSLSIWLVRNIMHHSGSHTQWYRAAIAYLKTCLCIRYIHTYFYWWME